MRHPGHRVAGRRNRLHHRRRRDRFSRATPRSGSALRPSRGDPAGPGTAHAHGSRRDGPGCSSSFTWQQVATRTAALYDDLLSERVAPSSDRRSVLTRRGAAGARQCTCKRKESRRDRHQLAQKIALVTGAGSGLGEATARRLAAAGACVACIDLDEERARSTAEAIDASGSRAIAVGCDVGDERAVQTAVDRTLQTWNRIDIAVNCAGVDYVLGIEEMTVAQWDRVIGVNLRGPFLVAKAVFPVMKRLAGGDIVNVASTAALRAWGNASAYHASKWGLVGFSRGLGVEGRADGIRVTTIIPGGMNTHWFDRFPEQGIPLPDRKQSAGSRDRRRRHCLCRGAPPRLGDAGDADHAPLGNELAMIAARSPLRISFGGGGTDLPAYYERFGGMVVSAAITPACHVSLTPYAGAGVMLQSRDFGLTVTVPSRRPVVIREPLSLPRAVLSWFDERGLFPDGVRIATRADVPPGSGSGLVERDDRRPGVRHRRPCLLCR